MSDEDGSFPPTAASLSRDDLFEVLGNDRRRVALEILVERDEPVDMDDLIDRVASREHGKPAEEVTSAERKAIYTALKQRHLPKLEEKGLVTCDHGAGVVESADPVDGLDVYLEIVEGERVPFSVVYLAIAGFGGLVLGANALDASPATVLPAVAWLSLLVGALGITSLVHLHYMRRMKVGPAPAPVTADDVRTSAETPVASLAPRSLLATGVATLASGLFAGVGMWIVLHYVMYLTPLLMSFYGLDATGDALAYHLGHSVLAAVPFAVVVTWTRMRAVARSAGETAALGILYGVVLWAVVEGVALPLGVDFQVRTLLTVAGEGVLYLPRDGLAAHVVYGCLLGGVFARSRRYLGSVL